MPSMPIRQSVIANAKRIVVKVGTNSICDENGRPDRKSISSLARQIATVREMGVQVLLVASGAIGAGLDEMGMDSRPKTMPHLQAVAAVGQGRLMQTFHDIFARHNTRVAQVLVTRDDFDDRTRYLNIRNTLSALAEFDALPIINENDTVAVDDIRFGENDILAAIVSNMLNADVMILLSNVDGVLADGNVIDVIERVDDETMSLVQQTQSRLGSGGMGSKMQAAEIVTRAGEVAVIANARQKDVLPRLLSGQKLGTVFMPATVKMSSKQRWMDLTARTAGVITVDSGAANALLKRGKSLLPAGIIAAAGDFAKGALVAIEGPDGLIAKGLSNYSSDQLQQIMGLKTNQIAKTLGDKPYNEAVHRNNMTLT